MKTLVLSNGTLEQKDIKDTLDALQEIVGGYIEIPFISKKLFEHEIDIIINEEGKLIEGFKPEIAVIERGTFRVLDLIYGNCIFASHDEEGNTIGLSDEQINIVKEELKMEVVLTDKSKDKDFIVKTLFI